MRLPLISKTEIVPESVEAAISKGFLLGLSWALTILQNGNQIQYIQTDPI